MKKNLTEIVFILDESGSMYHLTDDTIGGFNRVLAEHKAMEGEAYVTTILFNDHCRLLHDRLPVQAVAPITAEDYRAGGCTALMDAIGMGISKVEAVQNSVSEDFRAERVQFVIITDGMENSSREYSRERIRRSISDHQEKGWDFVFLGANIDAVKTAESMGIDADRAVTAMADSRGVSVQYDAVLEATANFRRCGSRGTAWRKAVEEDRKRRGE